MAHRIILTGASSGIGAALALEYARPGASMLLIARDEARLEETAEAVRATGAEALTAAIDVTDAPAMKAAIEAFDDAAPVDLIIANAGVALGRTPGGVEAPGVSRTQVEINLMGMLHTVEPMLPRLIARKAGRIALMGSIAGLRPQADIPTYSATKAAVHGYGEAIRSWLRGHGVSVTIISPGFITSPMSARHHGPKPFEISAAKAAAIMARAIEARRGRLVLPWPWSILLWFEQFLPARISDWFERLSAADIK